MKNGFVKVAAASPVIRVADADYNAGQVIEVIRDAARNGVKVLAFPELTLTGCSCYDLFTHRVLLDGAREALLKVAEASSEYDLLAFVGLPLAVGAKVYNVAAALYHGEILAFIPAEGIADGYFSVPDPDSDYEVNLPGYGLVPMSCSVLFEHETLSDLRVAAEVGAGLQRFLTPAVRHAEAGATLIVQLGSFPETVTSREEAELNARYESRQFACGMVLAAPGKGESSTDRVFSGLCLVAENGKLLASEEKAGSFASSCSMSCVLPPTHFINGLATDSVNFIR